MARVAPTRTERLFLVVIAALVLTGLWLRSRGILWGTLPFWLDECDWGVRLMEQPLREHLIRPIGFMALSKLLAVVFSPSETVLRIMSWLAGVVAVLLSPFLARRLYTSWAARLFFVACIALQPAAIDLAKEFKPYAVGLTWHLMLLSLALRYVATSRTRDLVYTLVAALTGVLFSQDLIFAYPGLFLVLGYHAWRRRDTRQLVATAGTALAIMLVIGGLYFYIWRNTLRSEESSFWAEHYDIFYVPGTRYSRGSRLSWLFSHYQRLAAFVGKRRDLWSSETFSRQALNQLRSADVWLWIGLHVVGTVVIFLRKRLMAAVLLFLPIAVMIAFNVLGAWPFGPFRANLFVLAYFIPIAAFAFELDLRRVRWLSPLPALAFVVLPLLLFERNWHKDKLTFAFSSDFPNAIAQLIALQGAEYHGPPQALALDGWSCDPWSYYTKYNPAVKKQFGAELGRRFAADCFYDPSAKVGLNHMLKVVRGALHTPGDRAFMLANGSETIRLLSHRFPRDLDNEENAWGSGHRHWAIKVRKP